MKTVIIYDQVFEQPISFCVVEGDFRHLNGVYINHSGFAQELQDELCAIIFDTVTWETKPELVKEFPTQAVAEGAFVITCGFLP